MDLGDWWRRGESEQSALLNMDGADSLAPAAQLLFELLGGRSGGVGLGEVGRSLPMAV